MKQPDKTLIFMHIPKAAGSTLGGIIRRQYADGKILDTYSANFRSQCADMNALESARFRYNYVKSLPEAERRKVRAYLGHEGFGFHHLFPQPTTYITMLREPVDRILSYYYYVHQSPQNRMYETVVDNEMSLEAFVSSDVSNELDNSQTKFLAGLETPYLYEGEYGDDLLEKAKQNIENHFSVVGLTERFNESLLLFKSKLGWTMPFYKRANVTQRRLKREDVSPETLAIIQERNALDIALYRYASERFAADIAVQGDSFTKELSTFNFWNKSYTLFHNSYQSVRNFVSRN